METKTKKKCPYNDILCRLIDIFLFKFPLYFFRMER